jgi:hypothetical protein
MILIRKDFGIPMAEIKSFVSNLPILAGVGMKGEMTALKEKYEKAGCVTAIEENSDQYDFKSLRL